MKALTTKYTKGTKFNFFVENQNLYFVYLVNFVVREVSL